MKKLVGSKAQEDLDIDIEGIEENENDSISQDDIKNPFDPKDIKISVEPKSLDSLITRMRHEEIDLNTEFQRKGNLWNQVTQSRLIESLLLKFPLPVFYFDASNDEKWLVVDGLQRLWTLKNFVIDKTLYLRGLEILEGYNDLNYDRLSLTLQRRINETQVTTYLIQPSSPKKVKYYVFRRINTGGLILNAQEIRHALNQEQAADYLRDIAESEKVRDHFRIPNKRMQDRELILRGLTFIFRNFEDYEKPLIDFLDKSMEALEKMKRNELNLLKEKFYTGLDRSRTFFGKHVFSRSVVNNANYRLNAALFEVWVSEFAKLSYEEFESLVDNRGNFMKEYKDLIKKDKEFENSIIAATSNKNSVSNRFTKIQSLIFKYTK
jgi:hypothetical protein